MIRSFTTFPCIGAPITAGTSHPPPNFSLGHRVPPLVVSLRRNPYPSSWVLAQKGSRADNFFSPNSSVFVLFKSLLSSPRPSDKKERKKEKSRYSRRATSASKLFLGEEKNERGDGTEKRNSQEVNNAILRLTRFSSKEQKNISLVSLINLAELKRINSGSHPPPRAPLTSFCPSASSPACGSARPSPPPLRRLRCLAA